MSELIECPECDSDNCWMETVRNDDDNVVKIYHCDECGEMWKDI